MIMSQLVVDGTSGLEQSCTSHAVDEVRSFIRSKPLPGHASPVKLGLACHHQAKQFLDSSEPHFMACKLHPWL